MKKLMAITLAILVLVFSMSIAASAAGGTITIKGATKNAQYTLYKIFDVDGDTYSIPAGSETAYQATTGFSGLFDVTTSGGKTYATKKGTDEAVIAWATTNKALFTQVGTTQTAASEGATVTFAPTENGYYYINSTSTPSKAIIYHVTDNITINEKNGEPSWGDGGKNSDKHSADFGEVITYTLNYNNALNYSAGDVVTAYKVEDTLPAGITYTGSFSVKINGTAVSVDPTVSGQSITATIPWTQLDAASIPATIQVTYQATVTSSAAVATPLVNTAKIYPITATTPDGPPEKPERKTEVITGQITVDKTDAQGTKLSGAKFVLKNSENMYYKLDAGVVTWVARADADVKITDGNGAAAFTGLKAGAYTLIETEAPASYTLPSSPETAVTLTATTTTDTNGNTVIETTTTMSQAKTIVNSKAGAMPETGGIGTTIFYILGGVLFAGALIILIAKRRVGSKG